MCRNNSCIWTILLIVIFFNCGVNGSRPLGFDNFFRLDSSAPFFPGTGAL